MSTSQVARSARPRIRARVTFRPPSALADVSVGDGAGVGDGVGVGVGVGVGKASTETDGTPTGSSVDAAGLGLTGADVEGSVNTVPAVGSPPELPPDGSVQPASRAAPSSPVTAGTQILRDEPPTIRPLSRILSVRDHSGQHLPLVKVVPGLPSATASPGPVGTPKGPSPCYRVDTFAWGTIEELQQGLVSPQGAAAAADLANFATGGATLLVFEDEEI